MIQAMEHNDVLLLESETGSGKTVLAPKYALHYTKYAGNVIVTIPKREITLNAASYAAKTLDVNLGEHVGYAFSGAPKTKYDKEEKEQRDVRLIYVTDGTLLRMIGEDPLLSAFTVVIIDEAHERKTNIDLLMLYMKELLVSGKRPDLRLIVMSATIDLDKYLRYFDGLRVRDFKLQGGTNYPVEMHYLEPGAKPDLVRKTRDIIANGETGNIMAFVTSGNEAKKSCRVLTTDQPQVACVEMYSKMTMDHRDMAIVPGKYLETGKTQKVIYATNMGVSSLTVDDLDVVIDNGYELKSAFEPKIYGSSLLKSRITQAQAIQRSGRVGRTHPGKCYRLYTEKEFRAMPKYPVPEILDADVTMPLLQATLVVPDHTLQSAQKMFRKLMDPPRPAQLTAAQDLCKMYDLIDARGLATETGKIVIGSQRVPIHHTMFMIYAEKFGCLKAACMIVSLITVLEGTMDYLFLPKVPFQMSRPETPAGSNMVQRLAEDYQSDHLALWDIFQQYVTAPDQAAWGDPIGIRLDLLYVARKEANKLFRSIRQLLYPPTNPDAVRPASLISDHFPMETAIRTAIRYSHLHLSAEEMRPVISNLDIKITPNQGSFLKKDRAAQKKMIVYDAIVNVIGAQWITTINTLIDPIRDTLPK